MKVCSKCKEEKPINFFNKKANHGTGLDPQCRTCKTNNNREYYKRNKARIDAYRKSWMEKNKESVREYKRLHHLGELPKNQEDLLVSAKKNREDYLALNRLTLKEKNNKRAIAYRKKSPVARIKASLRSRVRNALNGLNKSASTFSLIGCEATELKIYLEGLFKPGMSWDNYGSWEIDHIKPCALFDLKSEEQQRLCFNYKNLQPLWKEENLSKGALWPVAA